MIHLLLIWLILRSFHEISLIETVQQNTIEILKGEGLSKLIIALKNLLRKTVFSRFSAN